MKFGKEFSSQMVPEWQQAYMNYGSLKKCLKDIMAFKLRSNHAAPRGGAKNHHGGGLSRKMTLYRTFSGLVSTSGRHRRGNSHDLEEGVPLTATSGPILCMRRLFEEKNPEQGWNGLKYFLTIVAVCLRTAYSIQKHQVAWRVLAAIFSVIAAIFST
ncbi:hypothetical protein F2Q70_00041720 [Brassica cretica]|uniref:SPX domain-containing protein n=1 Tax=Brassica cretica TaxID=69181 RepID=A0A8S9K5S7_BRACR|nr:hypothetical protein F2Q70_00041720 [Brassica cretica]